MIELDDLSFGVRLMSMSYASEKERTKLKTYNLFDFSRVKFSVAMWVAKGPEFQKEHDFLNWCFGDVHWRTEYEFIVCPWPYRDGEKIEDNGQKVDTYELYCVPNEKLLRKMVDEVSVSSAQKYLREERKRRNGR